MKKITKGLVVAGFILALLLAVGWHKDGVRMPGLFKENPYFAASGGGFIQLTGVHSLEAVSTEDDITQTLTIYGSAEGSPALEDLVLTGTTPVSGAVNFDTIFGIKLDAVCAGIILVSTEAGAKAASIPAGDTYCYNAGSLDSTTGNFPAGMAVTTTGWGDSTSNAWLLSDQYPAINGKCSDVGNVIAWKYQLSDDNVNWIDGAVSLDNMDNNQKRYAATEPYIRYMRFVLTHSVPTTAEANPSVNIIVLNK
jgi:hypothetical protein